MGCKVVSGGAELVVAETYRKTDDSRNSNLRKPSNLVRTANKMTCTYVAD